MERRVGRVVHVLRQRRGWTQSQLAVAAGSSRSVVSRIERGEVGGVSVAVLTGVFEALDARLELRPVWRGAALDRVLDEGHARLGAAVVRLLRRCGWVVEVEVTFSEYGERGSIDILAWHAASRTLLVVEIKTELGSVEGLLRPLGIKVRLAGRIAEREYGLKALHVGRLVVFPEDRTARRQVDRHYGVLRTALPHSARAVRRWLRAPTGDLRGLWFLTDSRGEGATRNPSAVLRVRRAASRVDDSR